MARLSILIVALVVALIASVAAWQLSSGISAATLLLCAVLTCPLWAPLRGLMRRDRKTFAWATLCVIPYFILGVTEAIANPERRVWAGLCLALALAVFVLLIAYLRVSGRESHAQNAG